MHVHDLGGGLVAGPRWIINFPTKAHWRAQSRLADIATGLLDLVDVIERLQIRSIAVPALGCGLGGLNWPDVHELIEVKLGKLPDVRVLLYAAGATAATVAAPVLPGRHAAPYSI
jgi:O-acetyl-ADP-ribose deacetylase (regulator of RNase III)